MPQKSVTTVAPSLRGGGTKPLRVSLVVPAYNEQDMIAGCLESAFNQTIPFDEIIVVDNNSTDRTAAIAAKHKNARVLYEKQQGVVYARDAGFNAATGDIIARCDGDTLFSHDWVEQIHRIFTDVTVQAVSGQVSYRDVALAPAFTAIDYSIRRYLSKRMAALGEQFLYGVNMAIRATAWKAVRGEVCHERRLHEDLDLAAHLVQSGQKIVYDPQLLVSISPRQAASGPRAFYRYTWSNTAVYRYHHMASTNYVRLVAAFVSCLYPAIYLLRRGYDPTSKHFSFSYMVRSQTRISPVAAFIPGD